MRFLEDFDFDKRPSRSRYAVVVNALINGKDGKQVKAVELKRGDDVWPADVNIDSVQGAIADQLRKVDKRARTFRVDENTLVVGLNEKPAPTRRRTRNLAPAA